MFIVKSRYKNPDKFIDRLKEELEWAKKSLNDVLAEKRRLNGQYWFEYKDGVTQGVALHDLSLIQKAVIGQPVRLEGKVVELSEDDGKYTALMAIGCVFLLPEEVKP